MEALRPRISNGWLATARSLLAPTPAIRGSRFAAVAVLISQLQGNKASFAHAPASSGNRAAANTTTKQASSGRASFRGSTLLSTGNPQSLVKTRASYSTEASVASEPTIHDVFEETTGTLQYIVADPATATAVIIDPVLDFDPATQTVSTQTADSLLSIVEDNGYTVEMILETHAHADHLTAASYLQHRLSQEQGQRPGIGIGKRIGQVQKRFGGRYGVTAEEYEGVFDKLFDDDEIFKIGNLRGMAIHLPGHTPDHLGYKIGDNVFCGDSVFHEDIGTARADFPGGSAKDLFKSGRRLMGLPNNVKIWTGHDYPPEGRDAPQPYMTVKHHRERNKHLMDGIAEEAFITLREERDKTLAAPRLLHQSLQMNIRAGRLPKQTEAGFRLLHLPLKLERTEW